MKNHQKKYNPSEMKTNKWKSRTLKIDNSQPEIVNLLKWRIKIKFRKNKNKEAMRMNRKSMKMTNNRKKTKKKDKKYRKGWIKKASDNKILFRLAHK